MATYRNIHTSFWQDAFVLDLTPEEKYFYLYLMTNSKTTQCGVYELPKKVMELETGYNRETVDKLLERFVEYGKIEYCDKTREVLLKNWHKHNSSKSPKVKACITREAAEIKHPAFKKYCIDTLCIDLGEEKEKEEEKEEEQEEEKEEEQIKKKSTIFDDVPCDLLEPIKEFAKFRKELKKPMTKRAVTLLLGKLHEMTGGNVAECEKILNQSIMNGWTSVYPLKAEGNPFKEALRKELANEQNGSNSNNGGYQGGLSKLLSEPRGD